MSTTPDNEILTAITNERKLDNEKTTDILNDNEKYTDYQIAKKLIQLKQSADSRDLVFSLSFSEVKKLMLAEKCYYTGKKFSSGLYSRSIDRVDSSLGYVSGNVVACTIEINRKKANLTHAEIVLLAKKISFHQNKKRYNEKKKKEKINSTNNLIEKKP